MIDDYIEYFYSITLCRDVITSIHEGTMYWNRCTGRVLVTNVPGLPNGRLVIAEGGRHEILYATEALLEQNTIFILHDKSIERCVYMDGNWYTDAEDESKHQVRGILKRIFSSIKNKNGSRLQEQT